MLIKYLFLFIQINRISYYIVKLVYMTSNQILPEFQDFLLSRKLVPEKNVPYYARWVSRFLAFSNKSKTLDHETLTSEFIHSLESDENIADWQVLQAREALQIYLYHFRGADVLKEASVLLIGSGY
jgi:hypothetical protein